MNVISVADLASYLRQDIDSSDPSAQLYVRLANGIVTEIIGELADLPERVEAITLESAARAYRGSDGYTSVTKSFDDTSQTWRREATAERAGVYLTEEEKAELRALAGKPRRRARSIRLMVP